jgi:hypothetical protein
LPPPPNTTTSLCFSSALDTLRARATRIPP